MLRFGLWLASPRNEELSVKEFAPGLLIIGTDGAGEAYGFDLEASPWGVVMVPLVGLARDLQQPIARTFSAWLYGLAEQSTSDPPSIGDRLRGMNICERNPVILGGDPADRADKVFVEIDQLISIAAWWNPQIRAARMKQGQRGRDG